MYVPNGRGLMNANFALKSKPPTTPETSISHSHAKTLDSKGRRAKDDRANN
jgi:hypothetical protein